MASDAGAIVDHEAVVHRGLSAWGAAQPRLRVRSSEVRNRFAAIESDHSRGERDSRFGGGITPSASNPFGRRRPSSRTSIDQPDRSGLEPNRPSGAMKPILMARPRPPGLRRPPRPGAGMSGGKIRVCQPLPFHSDLDVGARSELIRFPCGLERPPAERCGHFRLRIIDQERETPGVRSLQRQLPDQVPTTRLKGGDSRSPAAKHGLSLGSVGKQRWRHVSVQALPSSMLSMSCFLASVFRRSRKCVNARHVRQDLVDVPLAEVIWRHPVARPFASKFSANRVAFSHSNRILYPRNQPRVLPLRKNAQKGWPHFRGIRIVATHTFALEDSCAGCDCTSRRRRRLFLVTGRNGKLNHHPYHDSGSHGYRRSEMCRTTWYSQSRLVGTGLADRTEMRCRWDSK